MLCGCFLATIFKKLTHKVYYHLYDVRIVISLRLELAKSMCLF